MGLPETVWAVDGGVPTLHLHPGGLGGLGGFGPLQNFQGVESKVSVRYGGSTRPSCAAVFSLCTVGKLNSGTAQGN